MDVAELTAVELLEAYARRDLGPVEAVDAALRRIAEVDPALNAVIHPLASQAREQARDSERRWGAGTARPLEGVPYGLKDIIATAGVRTTGGSALFADHVPDRSAPVASRLQAAGAVLVGKLHTFEFACGGAENQAFGVCRNPWDTTRATGGSSSGPAAAVAGREVAFAIGTDTAGSVRIPAAYCGIVGVKPTFGRVPRSGVMPVSWSLDHVGPMARTAADCALVLQTLAGFDDADPTSSPRAVPAYLDESATPPERARLGRPRGWFEDSVEPSVLAAFEEACDQWRDLGVEIVDVTLPDAHLWDAAVWSVIYAEMLSLHQEHVHDIENRDVSGAAILSVGPFIHAVDYLRALRYRSIAQRQLAEAMRGLTGLLTPSVTTVPPPLADISTDADTARWLAAATRMSTPFNLTGSPAVSLPMAPVHDLPTSMQIVTRPHDDATALALARLYQRHTDHHLRSPKLTSAAS